MKTAIIVMFVLTVLTWSALFISSIFVSRSNFRAKKYDLFAITSFLGLLNLVFLIISFVWFFSNLNFFFE
jgi:hypothetical protein